MTTTWIREKLINNLEALKDIGVVGIKQSFEDEGVILEDVLKIMEPEHVLGFIANGVLIEK